MSNGDGNYKIDGELKEYVDQQLAQLEDHLNEIIELKFSALKDATNVAKGSVDVRLDALKEATNIAKEGMDERLARMNEFRDALRDQNATFVSKTEFNAVSERLNEDIRSLRESRSELKGKAEQSSVNVATFIALISLTIGVISFIMSIFS